jgi:hypothetical protein
MKLSLFMVLAAISLSLLACEEKKDEPAKPGSTAAAAATATATAGATAKPAGTGGW